MLQSAGTLLHREGDDGLEVLIVKPSGFAAKHGWSIPKGLPDAGESLEAAARRETWEETGCRAGALTLLGHVDYKKSRKRIHCFAGQLADDSPEPRAASWEVTEARFVPADEAARLLHADQAVFVKMLRDHR